MPRLFACLFLLLLGLGLPAESFTNPRRLPTSGTPNTLLVGDLNNDGRQDILYGSGTYGAIVLHPLLAQPDGSFLSGSDIALPPTIRPRCLLADLNADGTLDLICAGTAPDGSSAYVAVLLGRGDATFQPAQITTLEHTDGSVATPAVVGDLNHDGHPDLILTGYQIVPLLGDGTGHLTAAPQLFSGSTTVIAQLRDLNGDGIPDIVTDGPGGGHIAVFLGNGDGTFGASTLYQDNASAVLADLDHDGHPDLIEGGNGVLRILHGNSDGSFGPIPLATLDFSDGVNNKSGFGTVVSVLACLDLNGDGIPDMLAGGDDGLTVLIGKPGLTFAPPTHYAVAQPFFIGPFMDKNALVDLNGDGHLDFLSVGANGIYILYGKPDGSFVSAPAYESGVVTGNGTSADFNNDGTPDVITTGDSNLHLRLGHGDGTFAPAVTIPGLPEPTSNSQDEVNPQLFHGDFNGDGKQDLLVAAVSSFDSTRTSYLRFGSGDGNFAASVVIESPIDNPAYNFPFARVIAIADVNHDGLDDILAVDLNNLYVSLSHGDGTFRRFATPIPSGNIFLTTADFNHDGILDIAYVNGPTLFLLVGRGDGTFNAPITVASTPSLSGSYGEADAITNADFDADGNPDIAILVNDLSSPGAVSACIPYVLFGDGRGSFSAPVPGPSLNTSHSGLYTADLDGDGRPDLLASGPLYIGDDYTLTIVHSLAGRTLGPSSEFTAGSGFPFIALTDLNRDGRTDILAVNGDSNLTANSFTVLLNQPGPPTVTGTLTASPEPSAVTQLFSLTATIAPPAGETSDPLTGTVSFSIDGAPLATAPLMHNTASIPGLTTLSPGNHQIAAVTSALSGNGKTYAPATFTATHVVIGLPTSLTLSANPDPAGIAQQVTFSFAASNAATAPAGAPQPTGSITLSEGATTLSIGTTSGTSGFSFNASHSFLSAGNHTITATYSGDALHAPATISITVSISQVATTTTVALSRNPSIYGQPVTLTARVAPVAGSSLTPTGTVLFTFCRGATLRAVVGADGIATINSPVSGAIAEPVGTCSVVASYSGDANLLPSSSTIVPYTITQAASATALTAKPNPAYEGRPVTLDAYVTGIPAPTADPVTGNPLAPAVLVPTGTIQIREGSTVLGSARVANGHALILLSSLAVGTHTLIAAYTGDANLLDSQSPAITETILPSSFTIALSTPSLTVKGGSTAELTVVATSVGDFSGPLNLSVSNLPSTMVAAFRPAPINLSAATASQAALAITTQTVLYTVVAARPQAPTWYQRCLQRNPIALALLLTAPWLFRRGRTLPTLLVGLLAVGVLGSSLGCTTVIERISFPPPTTYTLTVTATDPRTGVAETALLSLTVTP